MSPTPALRSPAAFVKLKPNVCKLQGANSQGNTVQHNSRILHSFHISFRLMLGYLGLISESLWKNNGRQIFCKEKMSRFMGVTNNRSKIGGGRFMGILNEQFFCLTDRLLEIRTSIKDTLIYDCNIPKLYMLDFICLCVFNRWEKYLYYMKIYNLERLTM